MTDKPRKPSKTRVVIYWFRFDVQPAPIDIDKILKRAELDGIITVWDDGRGRIPWFEGPPGPKIRALRNEFLRAGAVQERPFA